MTGALSDSSIAYHLDSVRHCAFFRRAIRPLAAHSRRLAADPWRCAFFLPILGIWMLPFGLAFLPRICQCYARGARRILDWVECRIQSG
jgi:hypothetical protein